MTRARHAPFPFRLVDLAEIRARLGLVVLQMDETVEQDFRRLFPSPHVEIYVSRIPSAADVTSETLTMMEDALPHAAGLFPAGAPMDCVGFACTSGAGIMGPEQVSELVRSASRARHVTNPHSAAIAGLRQLGISRIGLVSPYIEEVATVLAETFGQRGIEVTDSVTFGERTESRVVRIDPASIRAAALEVGRDTRAEAVFLSCTNLRTLGVIEALERELGKPVLSSNLALAWHMAHLAAGPLPAIGSRLVAGT